MRRVAPAAWAGAAQNLHTYMYIHVGSHIDSSFYLQQRSVHLISIVEQQSQALKALLPLGMLAQLLGSRISHSCQDLDHSREAANQTHHIVVHIHRLWEHKPLGRVPVDAGVAAAAARTTATTTTTNSTTRTPTTTSTSIIIIIIITNTVTQTDAVRAAGGAGRREAYLSWLHNNNGCVGHLTAIRLANIFKLKL